MRGAASDAVLGLAFRIFMLAASSHGTHVHGTCGEVASSAKGKQFQLPPLPLRTLLEASGSSQEYGPPVRGVVQSQLSTSTLRGALSLLELSGISANEGGGRKPGEEFDNTVSRR